MHATRTYSDQFSVFTELRVKFTKYNDNVLVRRHPLALCIYYVVCLSTQKQAVGGNYLGRF